MSLQIPTPQSKSHRVASTIDLVRETSPSPPSPRLRRRPFSRTVMHWTRRMHLYLGLLLFPWAVLYGLTGFLFNHPAAFSDQQTRSFSQQDWVGTSLEKPLTASVIAQEVIDALKKRTPDAKYELVNPEQATFAWELAIASEKVDGQKISVLLDVLGRGGEIRTTAERAASDKAPFAVGPPPGNRQSGVGERLAIDNPIHERIKAAVPSLLTKLGYPVGEVSIGNFPDLVFQIKADNKTWIARYNATAGTVSGRPVYSPVESMSVRRFLTRLHLAHGYTYSIGSRWFWAIIVDLMAFVMLFWGGSGLLMWWQIKMTRRWGMLALAASVVAASMLTIGMWQVVSL